MPSRGTRLLLLFALAACSAVAARAQDPGPQDDPATSPAPKVDLSPAKTRPDAHPFWDKQNKWLFTGVGAARTLDYFSTLNFRRRGVQEEFLTDSIVDNHAAFAAIEAGGTALSIGASYLFHRYGHHKLERWTSYVHIGLATSGAIRNYCLPTLHQNRPSGVY